MIKIIDELMKSREKLEESSKMIKNSETFKDGIGILSESSKGN